MISKRDLCEARRHKLKDVLELLVEHCQWAAYVTDKKAAGNLINRMRILSERTECAEDAVVYNRSIGRYSGYPNSQDRRCISLLQLYMSLYLL
jgi:hypothetical protein